MSERVRFFEEALDEAEHERKWYRERSPSAETSFLRELDHAVEIVSEAPHRWPRYLAGTRRYVFRRFPFSLIYFVEDDVIMIVAIANDRKRPGYWRGRLRKQR